MYSRDVSTDSDPNLFQSCKMRKILHKTFYIKIAKWTSKSKNYRMTNKKGFWELSKLHQQQNLFQTFTRTIS